MDLNPFWLFLISGVVLLAIELVIFQLSTFWLLFIGLGALVAAAYAWLDNDASYITTTGVFLVASIAFTALLYAPIRRWQTKPSAMSDNTAIGKRVVVKEPIGVSSTGTVTWSGSDWQAELADGETASLSSGDNATVVSVSGIRLFVKPVQP